MGLNNSSGVRIPSSPPSSMLLSSRGLGHDPFTVGTPVRIRLGAPRVMQRWQSGPMRRTANPESRWFKSSPLLQNSPLMLTVACRSPKPIVAVRICRGEPSNLIVIDGKCNHADILPRIYVLLLLDV